MWARSPILAPLLGHDLMDELAPFLKYTKPVIRYNLRDFDSFVRWAANVVHQNYHPDGCGWQECMKPFCRESRKALDKMHGETALSEGP